MCIYADSFMLLGARFRIGHALPRPRVTHSSAQRTMRKEKIMLAR